MVKKYFLIDEQIEITPSRIEYALKAFEKNFFLKRFFIRFRNISQKFLFLLLTKIICSQPILLFTLKGDVRAFFKKYF